MVVAWAPLLTLLGVTACSSSGDGTSDSGEGATSTTAVTSTTISTTTSPVTSAVTSSGFDPSAPGPFRVGHTSFQVTDADRAGRTLPVDVWYPATEVGGEPEARYPLVGEISFSVGEAVEDPPAAEGPFPLVIFSHGNTGIRTQSVFLTEALASHGFVVAAPDHVGNTAADVVAGTEVDQIQAAFDRPPDVTLVIDELLARSDTDGDLLGGRVDPERIAMTGHSFGALTSFLLVARGPDGPAEPRIDAIAPIAPVSFPLSDATLATVVVPTLLVAGSEDTQMPVDPETERPWALLGSQVVHRADIEGAGHMAFSHICEISDALSTGGVGELVAFLDEFSDGACDPEAVPTSEIHDLTNRYVVAFLVSELATDPQLAADAAAQLTGVDGVDFRSR